MGLGPAALLLVLLGPASAAQTDSLAIDEAIAEITHLVSEAHFETAKGVAESTLDWAGPRTSTDARDTRLARLHVLLATAQVALGEPVGAHASLREARALDPALSLDTRTASPKLVRVWIDVQAAAKTAARRP